MRGNSVSPPRQRAQARAAPRLVYAQGRRVSRRKYGRSKSTKVRRVREYGTADEERGELSVPVRLPGDGIPGQHEHKVPPGLRPCISARIQIGAGHRDPEKAERDGR